MGLERPTLVILGSTGDLTRRLIMPAIYRLFARDRWPDAEIVGYAMEDWSRDRFLSHLRDNLVQFAEGFDASVFDRLAGHIDYVSGNLNADALSRLKEKLTGSAVFYLALPPTAFADAAAGLAGAGLAGEEHGFRRLVIEKPFGWDLASARLLRGRIHEAWHESQVLRIDHFLGKETTQNLLVFRFANRFLEPVWNAQNIMQVQITVSETLGLEGRYQYYERAGALRDMLQNHLMQLFALTAMDPPSQWDADVLREHKVEVLRAVRRFSRDDVPRYAARGQYSAGKIGERPVPGYREEEHVPPGSVTDTFAALRLYVDNWRWQGVPFYLRSGKRLAADVSEVAIEFRPVPQSLFGAPLVNWLVFRMKPHESVDIRAWAKKPGLELEVHPVTLTTPYRRAHEMEYSAYDQLLLDALAGDRTYFLRFDEVEEAWDILEPVLQAWQESGEDLDFYPAGSQGPAAQERLMEGGHGWLPIRAR